MSANFGAGMEAEQKVDVKEEAEPELEEDAPKDSRRKLGQPVRFLTGDTTPGVVPSTVGNMLLSIKDGGLQFLCNGARCNVGVKSGRYAFEVKIVEALDPANPSEDGGKDGKGKGKGKHHYEHFGPKSLLRVGFSTKGSGLIIGDEQDTICFDEYGSLLYKKDRLSRSAPVKGGFWSDSTSNVIVLNLDSRSKNFNTISLFKNGRRACKPQALPEALKGQVLYPTVSFKNLTVHTNFTLQPDSPLAFKCRMLEDAAAEDVVVTEDKSTEPEVLFPVCLPDEGSFDWLDYFLKTNDSRYTELSDRAMQDWAVKSGMRGSSNPRNSSNDKPGMTFNIANLDDGSVKETLLSLSPLEQRNFVVMEVKGNLIKEERMAALKKWQKLPHKKVAQIVMGVPDEGFRKRTHAMMLAEKQDKINKKFESEKAEKAKKKAAALQARQAEKAKKKAEKARLKAEAENAAQENGAPKEEDVKEEESDDDKMEVEEDAGPEVPEQATLTQTEMQALFRTFPHSDLAQAVFSASFNKFSLPDVSEGFDEVRCEWSSAEDSAEHLKAWMNRRKLTIRIEDIQPSDWFRQKWQDWQKDLQGWHTKHVEHKDPSKKAPAPAAQSKAAGPPPGPGAFGAATFKAPPAAKPDEKKEGKEEEKKPDATEDDADKDPMQLLEEEMDREEGLDIFGLEEVTDMKDGSGTPLFSNFAFEDWALLSLRFEVHLLVHAFRHDANDADRAGICPDHVAFYYNKYYKKGLNPKNYGVESVTELLELIKDTVLVGVRSDVVESMVTDDLDTNDIFVKLTEDRRRDRQRRIDSGDESAQLKFSRPANPAITSAMNAGTPSNPAAGSMPGMVRPPGPAVGAFTKAGAPPIPGAAAAVSKSGGMPMGGPPMGAKGGWNGGYGKGGMDMGKGKSFGGVMPGGMMNQMGKGAKGGGGMMDQGNSWDHSGGGKSGDWNSKGNSGGDWNSKGDGAWGANSKAAAMDSGKGGCKGGKDACKGGFKGGKDKGKGKWGKGW